MTIHYPSNPHKFEFDQSVADIFNNMAHRSIPLYFQYINWSALNVVEAVKHSEDAVFVMDIGCSVGFWLSRIKALSNFFEVKLDNLRIICCDTSKPMLRKTQEYVNNHGLTNICEVYELDITDMPVSFMSRHANRMQVINVGYVLQFIPRENRQLAAINIDNLAAKNCCVVLGQKETKNKKEENVQDDYEYRCFRLLNGYSKQEIDAKSKALKNSMWPETIEDTLSRFPNYNSREILRYLQFSVYGLYKK